jgi:hypothetical protein
MPRGSKPGERRGGRQRGTLEARDDIAGQLNARRANGMTRLRLGEFVAARAALEQCHGLRDRRFAPPPPRLGE